MRWVAFVRNVMLGREGLHRPVLLQIAADAGGRDVRSYLSTGNLTFETANDDPGHVATALEGCIHAVVGRSEMVAVRPLAWLRAFVEPDRFAGFDPAEWELEVAFLRHDAPELDPSSLPDPRRTVIVDVLAREVVSARPRTGGARPHVNRLTELAAGTPATSRGWSTLTRIAARA